MITVGSEWMVFSDDKVELTLAVTCIEVAGCKSTPQILLNGKVNIDIQKHAGTTIMYKSSIDITELEDLGKASLSLTFKLENESDSSMPITIPRHIIIQLVTRYNIFLGKKTHFLVDKLGRKKTTIFRQICICKRVVTPPA